MGLGITSGDVGLSFQHGKQRRSYLGNPPRCICKILVFLFSPCYFFCFLLGKLENRSSR
jgi:hypothetical protein